MLETKLMNNSTAELTVVYRTSWNQWVKKKYHFKSENVEVGFLRQPVRRNHVKVGPGSIFGCGGSHGVQTNLGAAGRGRGGRFF